MEIPYMLIVLFMAFGMLVSGALTWGLTKVLKAYDEERDFSGHKEALILLAIQISVASLSSLIAAAISIEVVGIGFLIAGGSAFTGGLMAPFWFKAVRTAGRKAILGKVESL